MSCADELGPPGRHSERGKCGRLRGFGLLGYGLARPACGGEAGNGAATWACAWEWLERAAEEEEGSWATGKEQANATVAGPRPREMGKIPFSFYLKCFSNTFEIV